MNCLIKFNSKHLINVLIISYPVARLKSNEYLHAPKKLQPPVSLVRRKEEKYKII